MQSIKIDVTKIDKALLYQGQKGTYLNIVLMENREGKDQYGNDGFVKQETSKEQRAAGIKGPIIGNWKHVGSSAPKQERGTPQRPAGIPPRSKPAPDPELDVEGDDIPF